jgi:hypothetical protein
MIDRAQHARNVAFLTRALSHGGFTQSQPVVAASEAAPEEVAVPFGTQAGQYLMDAFMRNLVMSGQTAAGISQSILPPGGTQ